MPPRKTSTRRTTSPRKTASPRASTSSPKTSSPRASTSTTKTASPRASAASRRTASPRASDALYPRGSIPLSRSSTVSELLQNGGLAVNGTAIDLPKSYAEEARQVEAILSGHASPHAVSTAPPSPPRSLGYWVAIILMEVLAFVWFRWAIELYYWASGDATSS